MNIIYAGHLDPGGTCLARLRALQEIEPDVVAFDQSAYFQNYARWESVLERLTLRGARFRRANADFRELCEAHHPDVVWIDKGMWLWPQTLEALKRRGALLVQHNTDALYPTSWRMRRSYRGLRSTLPYYRIYFTTNLEDYRSLSAQASPPVELTHLGYDHLRFDATPVPPGVAETWASDLLFVGHYEPRTESMILGLIDSGLRVRVYGFGWERARQRSRLRGSVQFRPLHDLDYVHALKSTKIGLCFVSEINGNQTAGRSFEIPACGTFLLAMRTPQHLECYTEGVEAEFFQDVPELVKKARFYLEHDDLREQIARRGHERCLGSDYSWARYMRDDWSKVLRLMDAAAPAPSRTRAAGDLVANALL